MLKVATLLMFLGFSAIIIGLQSDEVLGDPVQLAELGAVTGFACGEFGTTQGNGPCSFSPGNCATVPTVRPGRGVDCASPGAPCGSCTGGTDITCQGGYSSEATALCSLTTPACCTVSTCSNGITPALNTCECTGPATPPQGVRLVATMTYNLPPGC